MGRYIEGERREIEGAERRDRESRVRGGEWGERGEQ